MAPYLLQAEESLKCSWLLRYDQPKSVNHWGGGTARGEEIERLPGVLFVTTEEMLLMFELQSTYWMSSNSKSVCKEMAAEF